MLIKKEEKDIEYQKNYFYLFGHWWYQTYDKSFRGASKIRLEEVPKYILNQNY